MNAIFKSKLLWTLILVSVLGALLIFIMPKPIDMNLDRIGSGVKSVVFVYDLNLSASNEQTIEINKAREQLGQ